MSGHAALRGPLAQAAALVLVACVALDLVAVGRAVFVPYGSRASHDEAGAVARAPRLPAAPNDSAALADDTVPDDPFDPDRGAVVSQAGNAVPPPPVVADAPVALLGTVVRAGGGSVAVCRIGNEPPRVLRVGERIGALTLLDVGQGSAAFRDTSGARVSLHIATPGA